MNGGAFGARVFGTALVVTLGSTGFWDKGRSDSFFDHCRRIEVDYQSGSKHPRSKGCRPTLGCTYYSKTINPRLKSKRRYAAKTKRRSRTPVLSKVQRAHMIISWEIRDFYDTAR